MGKRFYMLTSVLIIAVLFILYMPDNLVRAYSDPDNLVFKRNCSKCHSIDRVLGVEKTSIRWEKTVDWMRKKQNTFSETEGEKIKRYLKETHAYYPKIIFEAKCAKCHSLNIILQQKRPPQEWNNLVERERLKAITWISLDEAHDIAMYLKGYNSSIAADNNGLNKPMAKEKRLIEEKCLLCHLYSTVFEEKRTQQEWRAINQRMQFKCPQWINDKQVEEILEYFTRYETRK